MCSGHEGLAARPNGWAYVLSSGVYPEHKQARGAASTRFVMWRCSLPFRRPLSFESWVGAGPYLSALSYVGASTVHARCSECALATSAISSSVQTHIGKKGQLLIPPRIIRDTEIVCGRWSHFKVTRCMSTRHNHKKHCIACQVHKGLNRRNITKRMSD